MKKPKCKLLVENRSSLYVIMRVFNTLKKNKLKMQANKFVNRTIGTTSYDALLRLAMEYVEIETI